MEQQPADNMLSPASRIFSISRRAAYPFRLRDRHTSLGIWFPIPSHGLADPHGGERKQDPRPRPTYSATDSHHQRSHGAAASPPRLGAPEFRSPGRSARRISNLTPYPPPARWPAHYKARWVPFTILYANDGYLNMVGYTRSQLRKEKRNAAVSLCASEEQERDDASDFQPAFPERHAVRSNTASSGQRHRLWALIRGRQVWNDPELGQIGVWVIIDVTEQKETQLAFRAPVLRAGNASPAGFRQRKQAQVPCGQCEHPLVVHRISKQGSFPTMTADAGLARRRAA